MRPAPVTQVHESFARRVLRRAGWAVRDRWPNRKVVREVQGVRMTLPWAHRLPDYARVGPLYGQNLVELATLLGRDQPLVMVDVGANVGDSTLQVLNVTDGRVLCVEGDEVFLEFLRINVGDDPRVSIEPSLLAPEVSADVDLAPVRIGGTTRFEPGQSTESAPMVSVDELRRRHPGFDDLRLVKSDTDGHDVLLVPALARAWASSRPVLFFEYDERLSHLADNDPRAVWAELGTLGYDTVAAWDHGGRPLGRFDVADAPGVVALIDEQEGVPYWDVAVVHTDDEQGQAALEQLVPGRLGR